MAQEVRGIDEGFFREYNSNCWQLRQNYSQKKVVLRRNGSDATQNQGLQDVRRTEPKPTYLLSTYHRQPSLCR